MKSNSASTADVLADYRELLRIAGNRPSGILSQSETHRLITYLEACIAEIEAGTSVDLTRKKLTG